MMKCGLLGQHLGHSYSPQIHGYLADYSYNLFEREPEDIRTFLQAGDFTGLNVTIPYKKTVMPLCDELTETARMIGAVNTLVRCPDGRLLGHNSDYYGFCQLVQRSGLKLSDKKALVLGSGGASNTAVKALEAMGARVVVISRSGENHYGNLTRHGDAACIVNTTPVGMFPHNGESPLSLDGFPMLEGVLDVVYNPARTRLLLDAERRGLVAENGLWMLVAQAKESAEYFTGHPIPDDQIARIHGLLRREMENIILIGMPGCGKSTVAKLLGAALGKTVVDGDSEIEAEAGCAIPEIFSKHGEAGFREIESRVLARLGRQSGVIIATGGGCVTREENYPSLHQNGSIFWLKRDIACLPTQGRPLSQANSLEQMYGIRKPMYERFADYQIDNNADPRDAVEQILRKLDEVTI